MEGAHSGGLGVRETKEGVAALLDVALKQLADKASEQPTEFVVNLPAGAILRLESGDKLLHLGEGRFASEKMLPTLEGAVQRGSPEDAAWPDRYEQRVRQVPEGHWRAVTSAPRVTRALAEEVARKSGVPIAPDTLDALERADAAFAAAAAREDAA